MPQLVWLVLKICLRGAHDQQGKLMGHGVGPYIGLNEIGSSSPIMIFITINYLFNFIFGFIRWYFGFIY